MNKAVPSGGKKNRVNEERLTYIDNIILDNINEYGELTDTVLAQRLHCPRTLLLGRLQSLLNEGYLYTEADKYILSESGRSKWIPLRIQESSVHHAHDKPQAFDWTGLYIPQEGWQK